MDLDLSRRAWFPAAENFAENIGHVSNFPFAYVYAVFLALSGHIIGRQAYIWYGSKLYGNQYICLVGPSGLSHKSTAMNLGIETLGEELQEQAHIIRDMTTSSGLMQAMVHGNGATLAWLDELGLILQKKRQDFAAGLISKIVELYGTPNVTGNWTRFDPLTVEKPFLSILSGSTIEWLRSSLSTNDLMAGFGNRMTFVLGTPRPVKYWPRKPYLTDLGYEKLLDFVGPVDRDQDADDLWKEFYDKFEALQQAATPFMRVMCERLPEKILKCALVQAAWANTMILNGDIMERSIDWGRYLYWSIKELAPSFEHVEKQVLQKIEAGLVTRQQLFASMGHAIPTKRIREALENLTWLGLAHEDKKEGKWYLLEEE